MIKEFNDVDFILYGKVQSFFYRCWSMFGEGRDDGREFTTKNKYETMDRWVNRLFMEDGTCSGYRLVIKSVNGITIPENNLETMHSGVSLFLSPNRTLHTVHFQVDINEPLEQFDIYNIKWVRSVDHTNSNDNLVTTNNKIFKEVPVVFGTKEENT